MCRDKGGNLGISEMIVVVVYDRAILDPAMLESAGVPIMACASVATCASVEMDVEFEKQEPMPSISKGSLRQPQSHQSIV